MVSTFAIVSRTRAPRADLFDASLSIDEHIASMAGSGERAIDGVVSGSIGLGETVTWRARHFGIWFTMTSAITALSRPEMFVDEQVRGPFRSFRHEHVFAREGHTTIMTDTISLGSPILGRIAERLILVPYLRRLIVRRNHHLLTRLGAAVSTDPGAPEWEDAGPTPFRRSEVAAVIGSGDAVWERASRDILQWAVKTRSGFTVEDPRPLAPGMDLEITARILGVTVREPVQVVDVVRTATRVGFSYRTREGHPVDGEEAFIVHRDGDRVILTVRSLTAPAARLPWRAAYPILRLAQAVARRRYLRALR